MIYLLPLLSVLLGYVIATFFRPKSKKNLKLLLAFSGSFLLALTVSHLLPAVYESSHAHDASGHVHNGVGFFIMFGIIFQIVLEYFSQGAEHWARSRTRHPAPHSVVAFHQLVLARVTGRNAGKSSSRFSLGNSHSSLPYRDHSDYVFQQFAS